MPHTRSEYLWRDIICILPVQEAARLARETQNEGAEALAFRQQEMEAELATLRAQLLASEEARANSDASLADASAALQAANMQLEQLRKAGGNGRGQLNHPAGQVVGRPSSR